MWHETPFIQVTLQLLGNSLSGAPTHINQMSFICGTNFKPTTHQLKTICLRDSSPLTADCKGAKFVNDLLVLFGTHWLCFQILLINCFPLNGCKFIYFLPFCPPAENSSCASLSRGNIAPEKNYKHSGHIKDDNSWHMKMWRRKFGFNCKRMCHRIVAFTGSVPQGYSAVLGLVLWQKCPISHIDMHVPSLIKCLISHIDVYHPRL